MDIKIIEESKTIAEAIKKCYGYDNGSTRKKFLNFIKETNLNIEHLTKRETKYTKVVKTCPVCGKEFNTIINHKDEKTTCSHSCSNTFFRSGENNPNWGKFSELKNAYRRICFEHHKQECVICGENKIVSVHHFDENHNNNSPENLIPLCPTHHQYVHSKFRDEVIDRIIEYKNKFLLSSAG